MNVELEFLIIIAPKNSGDKTVRELNGLINLPSVTRGRGTAPNSVLSALGIGEPEKDIVFCFAKKNDVGKIYDILMNELHFSKRHIGIAMTIPVSAVGGRLTLDLMTGEKSGLPAAKKRRKTK